MPTFKVTGHYPEHLPTPQWSQSNIFATDQIRVLNNKGNTQQSKIQTLWIFASVFLLYIHQKVKNNNNIHFAWITGGIVAMMPTLSSLVSPEVAIVTIACATIEDKVGIMTTFIFHCMEFHYICTVPLNFLKGKVLFS